jgi:hypothetical protein
MGKLSAQFSPIERDLRLDFFHGIGLWMIFLDHISDAAETFVAASGNGLCSEANRQNPANNLAAWVPRSSARPNFRL